MQLGLLIGRPPRADSTTVLATKEMYARLYVEVRLNTPLTGCMLVFMLKLGLTHP